jgi:YHS domain-containing protein
VPALNHSPSQEFTVRRVSLLFSILIFLAAFPTAQAQTPSGKILVNVNDKGIALQGYDPVSFFSDGRPAKGNPALTLRHEGATYWFATSENKATFEAAPERYVPAFGGYCAYGASNGYTAPVEIDTWQIVDGRLLLNYNKSIRKKFDADRAAYLQKADANWPGIVEKEGKALGEGM